MTEQKRPAGLVRPSDGLGPLPEGDRFLDATKFRRLGVGSGDVLYECWGEAVRAYAAEQVAAERERCRLAAHDAVMRALDEAGVYAQVLRGMCAEVAMERFSDELKA